MTNHESSHGNDDRRCHTKMSKCITASQCRSPQTAALASLVQLVDQLSSAYQACRSDLDTLQCCLRQLHQLGLGNPEVVLGDVVVVRGHGLGGPCESGQLIQAAMCSERGLGAVYWDSDDYQDLIGTEFDCQEAMIRFVKADECVPAIQTAIWQQVDQLLPELLRRVHYYGVPGIIAAVAPGVPAS